MAALRSGPSLRVAVIVGTRPEAVKLAPVIKAIRADRDMELSVISTAQHRELLDTALADTDIQSDRDLNLMLTGQSLAGFVSRCFAALERAMVDLKPAVVVAQGDTSTTMVAAIVSFYLAIPFAHVEAGLRSFDLRAPFPEEFNRVVATKVTDLHFAPTQRARANLLAEGVADQDIVVTGNTVIDSLLYVVSSLTDMEPGGDGAPRMLVTLHRRENFGEPTRRVCDAISQLLVAFPDLRVVWPVHPNPAIRRVVYDAFESHPRVELLDPLGYRRFVSAMLSSSLILTDSGGVQEEAPSIGKPVLVLRDVTERPEAVEAGAALIVGTDTSRIVDAVTQLLSDATLYRQMSTVASPFGDGHASDRIVQAIRERYL